MGDITKLPKWAQQEIAYLEKEAELWHGRATAGNEDTDTFVEVGRDERPLAKGARVAFRFDGPGSDHYRTITAHIDGDRLHIMGGHGIAVLPHVSNVIHVKLEER